MHQAVGVAHWLHAVLVTGRWAAHALILRAVRRVAQTDAVLGDASGLEIRKGEKERRSNRVTEVAAGLVPRHMTSVKKPGQRAAATTSHSSVRTHEKPCCVTMATALRSLWPLFVRACVFRLLAETILDCGGLVHPSSPLKHHFPFKVMCLLSAEPNGNNKHALKTTSCGDPVHLCHVVHSGTHKRKWKDRFDRSSVMETSLAASPCCQSAKVNKKLCKVADDLREKRQQQSFPTDRGPRSARASATCNNNPGVRREKARQRTEATEFLLDDVAPPAPTFGSSGRVCRRMGC